MHAEQGSGWAYRPGLDGLRTVAIYLVVLFHAGLGHFANGYIGVDVFFVLSGYLVTSIILREHSHTGSLRLRRFYARRVRRLLPASVALVAIVSLLSLLVLPRLTRVSIVADARASLLYAANWHYLDSATDYFADDVARSPFLHFWSLAVEEQFYFVFPLVLLALLVVARRAGRAWVVPAGLGTLLVASLAAQWIVADGAPLRAYYGTHTRLYQLLAGAALASVRHRLRPGLVGVRAGGLAVFAGVVALVVLATDAIEMSVANRGVLAVAVTTLVVAALEVAPRCATGAVLSTGPLTYLGRISYGTYLWHWPIIVLVGAGFRVSPIVMVVIAGVGATAVSAVSFAVLETPIRRAPSLDRHPRMVVAIGLTLSLLVAVVVVPPVLRSLRRPTWTAREPAVRVDTAIPGVDMAVLDQVLSTSPPAQLDVAATEPPPFDQATCTATDPATCIVHQGSGMRLHLVGDSNAMVLVPLLAELAARFDFTFSASVRVGCPWQLGLDWQAQDPALVAHCVRVRDEWYSSIIPALQPDVVLAVHVPRDPGSRDDGAFFEPGEGSNPDASIDEVVTQATDRTLDRLHELGARVVLFEPLPYDTSDPTICLSGANEVSDCAYEANDVPFPTESAYRAAAAARADVWAVDADALACPYLPVCVPMLDGELVFRNQFHLSNAWVLDHADQWWAVLTASGALDGWFEAA